MKLIPDLAAVFAILASDAVKTGVIPRECERLQLVEGAYIWVRLLVPVSFDRHSYLMLDQFRDGIFTFDFVELINDGRAEFTVIPVVTGLHDYNK